MTDTLHHHTVDGFAALDNAGTDHRRRNVYHPRKGTDGRFGGQVQGHRGWIGPHRGGVGLNAHVPREGAYAFPDGAAETAAHRYGHDNHEETDGDGHRRQVSLKIEFPRYEAFGYQMCTRSSSGRNMASPSLISKASKKVWKFLRLTFTRLTASECGSRLVRRAFSWSVMFWAQMAP